MNRYKPYPQYKDSGVEWLGEVPEHWEVKRLKYNLILQTNKVIIDEHDVIALENIESKTGKYITTESSYQGEDVEFKKGDILFGKLRPYLAKVYKCDSSGVAFGDLLTFRPNQYFDSSFAFYSLLSEEFIKIVDSSTYGAKMPRASSEFINEMFLATPLLAEQINIAKSLDSITCKIDTLIQKQQNLIELLKEKRQTAVENIIMQDKIINMRLGMVVDQIFRPVDRKTEEFYVALGLYNRGRGLFHKEPKEGSELGDSDFYWVQNGDLILSGQFAWEGSVALAGKSENNCIVSHRYPILRGKENIINTEYLWAFLTTKIGDFILNENSVGSAGRNRPLNINTLMKEKIPVPSLDEQLKISKIVQVEKKIIDSVSKTIELLKERRTALISAVVTGKIDVREIA